MNKTKSTIVSAAVAGLFLGSVATVSATLTSCGSTQPAAAQAEVDKHACRGLNSCKMHGGCKTDQNACKYQNSCQGKGGCATVQHSCAGKNDCRNQGGCQGTAGKNECKAKGGCAVPVKGAMK
jgi:hypothetical protein